MPRRIDRQVLLDNEECDLEPSGLTTTYEEIVNQIYYEYPNIKLPAKPVCFSELDRQDNIINDIIGVFVVAFDTRCGNTVEWSTPDSMEVKGLEFKAMASGAHKVQTDFIYFKYGQFYGLSCFENLAVDSVQERGARLKSVGVLARGYSLLHLYKPFLQRQARHLVENPGTYAELMNFYLRKRGPPRLEIPPPDVIDSAFAAPSGPLLCDGIPSMEITHPAGCFSQLLNFFGEKLFSLWRLTLLKKRILFFSPPPVGVICYRGTTEKIFEQKNSAYDAFIDQQNIIATPGAGLEPITRISSSDRQRYAHLVDLRRKVGKYGGGDGDVTDRDETWFTGYFMAQNTQLFKELLHCARSPDRMWTADHMYRTGLDPVEDRHFIQAMADAYQLDVLLYADTSCCRPTGVL